MIAPEEFKETGVGNWLQDISKLSPKNTAMLIDRAKNAPLFIHAYSFHLNFRFGSMTPSDLLNFAADHNLLGVKIHVEDGEENSLLNSPTARDEFASRAKKLGLITHIEVSNTNFDALKEAVLIAKQVGGTSVRCYPRYEARVSTIIKNTIADLNRIDELDPEGLLRFTLEQHEDLKSEELVNIIKEVNNDRLSLLFDFGNMINAYERPFEALKIQSSKITEVHMKDCHVVDDRGGWAQTGCVSGTGDIPFSDLLLKLLMLGDEHPQVTAFALEEEADYFAPAMRFKDEDDDPFINFRTASLTPVDEATIGQRLKRERDEAIGQITYVRGLLAKYVELAQNNLSKTGI